MTALAPRKEQRRITMKKKIFCCDCEFEKDGYCNHPRNLEDDNYAPKHTRKQTAAYINQLNDCKWFKRYKP